MITGLGVVSPLGIGRDPFWAALLAGHSGFAPPSVFDVGSMNMPVVAEVHGFDATEFVKPRKAIKLMCRETQLACAAAALAMQDAGIDSSQLAPDRFGTNFGSEMLYGMPAELEIGLSAQHCRRGRRLGSMGRTISPGHVSRCGC